MMDAADQLLKGVASKSQGTTDRWLRERRDLAGGQRNILQTRSRCRRHLPNY